MITATVTSYLLTFSAFLMAYLLWGTYYVLIMYELSGIDFRKSVCLDVIFWPFTVWFYLVTGGVPANWKHV